MWFLRFLVYACLQTVQILRALFLTIYAAQDAVSDSRLMLLVVPAAISLETSFHRCRRGVAQS
jgi:hypothetical protein